MICMASHFTTSIVEIDILKWTALQYTDITFK